MVCQGIESLSNGTIADFMSYPTTCDAQFYAKIMGAIWMALTLIIFYAERKRDVKPDFLSCAGISALAVIIISVIGTLLTIISTTVFLEILVLGGVFIVIWLIRDN